MECKIHSENKEVILVETKDKSYEFPIVNNKSFLNKINFLIDDLHELTKLRDDFDEFFDKLVEYVETGLVIFNSDKIMSKLDDFAETLVKHKIQDVSQFCDQTKRTRDSIFFDEQEMFELLKLIGVFKIIGIVIHSDFKEQYSASIQDLLNLVSDKYSKISKKLYQVISSKTLKGSITNKKYLNFLKYALSYDYLILYNFSFITNVLICLYNWTKNPVSYIVSLAGENFGYLIMTYSTTPITYTNEEVNVEVASSGDFLDSISFETILHTISEKFQDGNITIKDLFPTPVTDILILPLMSYISDVPTAYLESKSNYDKIMYQYLIYSLINKSQQLRSSFGDILQNVNKILLYGFEVPVQYGEGVIPSLLEVLKSDFTYYSLDNKIPVLNAVKTFSCFVSKKKHLRHIITGEAFPQDYSKNIQDILKSLVQFTIIVVSDDTRDDFRKTLKRQFIKFLGNVKLNKTMLGLLL